MLTSIRVRPLVFTATAITVTAAVASVGAFSVRGIHAGEARPTTEVSARLHRSHPALDLLIGAQISL